MVAGGGSREVAATVVSTGDVGVTRLEGPGAAAVGELELPAPELPANAALPARIGRYMPLRRLGAGAMGEVLLAYDEHLDRRVALKIVRAMGQSSADLYARMLREAQGLARLSHPNVVQVYEAGEFDGRVFLAMEYVEGETLRTWSMSHPRSWREVLARCLEAARGLAAAHAAGLVHRDFKPDNVIVGADGRVRVLDFGLVRAEGEGGVGDRLLAVRPSGATASLTSGALESELTAAHSLIGTPAYMSPEQHLREVADARADTFALCVTLYELLYGVRPFAGRDQATIMRAVLQRRLTPPPEGRRIPGWVRRAILRGLAVEPAARWPTIDALIAALERDPRAAWGRRLGIGAVAAALAGAGWAAARSDARERAACEGGAAAMAGIWDEGRREAVRAGLGASGVAYAEAVQARVEAGLDAYRDGWIAMHREACLDHRRGIHSGELLDRRMACLAERREALGALVEVLAGADAGLVERASAAVGELPRVAACGDLASLGARVRPPDDAAAAAAVQALRVRAGEARALALAGRYDDALGRVDALAADAASLGYAPLAVELDVLRGRVLVDRGDWGGAEAVLEAAYYEARALGHDAAALEAALASVPAAGLGRSDFAQAGRWLRLAEAEVRRGAAPGAEAEVRGAAAALQVMRGDYEAAIEAFERAIAARRRIDGDGHPGLVDLYSGLGSAYFKRGRMSEASATFALALAVGEVALGPEHPQVGQVLGRIGMIASRERRFDEAAAALERALAISEGALGAEHPRVAEVLSYLGELEIRRRAYPRAIERLRRAVAIAEAAHGEEHVRVATFLGSLTVALYKAGEGELALAAATRALVIGDARLGREHPNAAIFAANLGEILNERGAFAEARPHLGRAARVLGRALGESRPELGPIHRELARALLGVGEAEVALSHARLGVELTKGGGVEPDEAALAHFILAQAIAATGGDGEEARAHAEAARRFFAAEPALWATRLAAVDAWVARQAAASRR